MATNELDHKSIKIKLIQSIDDWKKLEVVWESLWEASPNPSIFSSFHFLFSWYLNINKLLIKPHILLLSDESNSLIGIAPLFKVFGWLYGIPIRTITFITDAIFADRPHFIIPSMYERQLTAIFNYLSHNRNKWDQLFFSEQIVNDTYKHIFRTTFNDQNSFELDIKHDCVAPYLSFSDDIDSWDAYLTKRSKGHRKKWRYFQNRLKKIGKLEVTRHTGYKNFSLRVKEYKNIERRSLKSRKMRVHKQYFGLYKNLIKVIETAGRIHIVFLRLNDRPIAGLIGLEYKKKYAAINTAFDKQFASHSPGFLVGGFDIQWAIANNLIEYDFMANYITDKLRWTNSFRKTSRSRVIHKRRLGFLYYLIKYKINPSIKSVINSNILFLKLKNVFRKPKTKINESKFDSHNISIKFDN